MAGRISAVLQSGGLLRDLSVRETVQMVASVFEDPRPIDEVLARAGLTQLAARKVAKCSGGEQQRLRFALALLPDPDLLVLDEPTAGMDVGARRDFWDTMHADADAGRTVVFATHYLEEAETFAERIVLMARGRVVADGSTAEIRARASGRTVTADIPDRGADDLVARLRSMAGRHRRLGPRPAGRRRLGQPRLGGPGTARRSRGHERRGRLRQPGERVPRHHRRGR